MTWIEQSMDPSVGDMLGLEEMLTPSIFVTETGCLGCVIQLQSESLMTQSLESVRANQAVWHRVLTHLSSRDACLVTEYRRKVTLGINQETDNAFLSQLTQPQTSGDYYQQDLFVTLLSRPRLLARQRRKTVKVDFSQQMTQLEKLRNLVLSLLRPFHAVLLAEDPVVDGKVSPAMVLGLLVNAGYLQAKDSVPQSLECVSLGSRVAHKQLMINRHIQYLGMNEEQKKLGAIVSVKKYPAESELSTQCALSRLACEWVRVQSFEPLEKESALKSVGRQRSKLISAADQSLSQRDELQQLEDRLAGDNLSVGYHQQSVLVWADNEKELDKNLTSLQAALIEQGFSCVREALGLELAFWGMQAGGLTKGVRKSLITSVNFSHLCPIRGFSTGHAGKNQLQRPICMLETQEKMPYCFNFHVEGSSDNPSLGHTLILGASNSGKTVLLTYLDAMRSGLGGKRFYFDRDLGAYLYVKAMGGEYLRFDPGNGLQALNPFSLPDCEQTRRFLTDWLEQMALATSGEKLAAGDRASLRACVDYAYDYLQREERMLSNALRLLPRSYPYLQNCVLWMREPIEGESGEYCQYFDNASDELTFANLTAFDMTYLLDQAPPLLRKLVLMYIFHRIEQACCGELVTITLDEGWQYFADPYWHQKMRSWLPTLRKLNAHIVLATQSPSAILESEIKAVFMDNCPTQLYFANDQASRVVYQEAMRLSATELSVIQTLPAAERWFLLKHARDSVVVRLNVKSASRYLPILSSNAKNCRKFESIQAGPVLSGAWIDSFLQQPGGEL
jgi:type IV secretion system protein VirB4